MTQGTPIERPRAAAYVIPRDRPEADGTLEWQSTTLVVVESGADGVSGWGYTYTDQAAAGLINRVLAPIVAGCDAMDTTRAWDLMVRSVRNIGRPGLASCAISAVDSALWDLKSRMLGVPLVSLLGAARRQIPVYASGGFTSYPTEVLREQLSHWAQAGFCHVKMKIGSHPPEDVSRVRIARDAVGQHIQLFVDANGAYGRKQALEMARHLSDYGVTWFEEPVSSDDLDGLRLLRDRAPEKMEIAAGEYGFDSAYFNRMLSASAVDVLQLDATRCGGVTGCVRAAALADAYGIPLSLHTAPALHLPLACALPRMQHLEYFHDHVRIERMLFDGVPQVEAGTLAPDLTRPGFGLELRTQDASRYAVA